MTLPKNLIRYFVRLEMAEALELSTPNILVDETSLSAPIEGKRLTKAKRKLVIAGAAERLYADYDEVPKYIAGRDTEVATLFGAFVGHLETALGVAMIFALYDLVIEAARLGYQRPSTKLEFKYQSQEKNFRSKLEQSYLKLTNKGKGRLKRDDKAKIAEAKTLGDARDALVAFELARLRKVQP